MLEPDIDFLPWQIIVKNHKNLINVVSQSNKEYVAAKGSTSVKINPLKRNIEEVESADFDTLPVLKKLQQSTPQEVGTSQTIQLRHQNVLFGATTAAHSMLFCLFSMRYGKVATPFGIVYSEN